MERNIPSHLFIHLIFFIFSAPPCAVMSDVTISNVVYISSPQSWLAAQNFCRTHYSDLATITHEEAHKIPMQDAWIGLHRDSFKIWKWSNGGEEAQMSVWDIVELDDPQSEDNCFLSGYETETCSEPHPFLCDEKLILVQEKKTWEQALLHCKQLHDEDTVRSYNLASLPEESTMMLDRDTIRKQAATEEVWIGLRFLAEEWLWMNGEKESSLVNTCPAQLQHCGALVSYTGEWDMMDCAEKRNFLCNNRTGMLE